MNLLVSVFRALHLERFEDKSTHSVAQFTSYVGRVVGMSAFLLGVSGSTWAQTPGQLSAKTFPVDFQVATGHSPNIQQTTLSGLPSITVEYDAAIFVLTWPDYRGGARPYWLKNTSTQRINDLNVLINDDNGNQVHGSAQYFKGLDAGERVQVSYSFGWSTFFPESTCPECFDTITGQEIPRNWSLTVYQCTLIAQDGSCMVSPPSVTVPQNFLVRSQSLAQRPLSATVRGRVYDAVTNQGIAYLAQVEVLNPTGEMRKAPFNLAVALTDRDPANPGNYSISVPAMTALVRCIVPGYQTQFEVATVAAGDTVTVDCPMKRMPWTASYTLKTTIDTSTGLWGWAVTPNANQVVLTPALSANFTASAAYAWMINLIDGSVAWKYLLGAQSAGPSISPNGQLVAVPTQEAPGVAASAVVLILDSADGHQLKSLMASTYFNPSSSAFSPDGAYLAVGGFGGELWLIDTADYATVWFKQMAPRQVRAVAWSPDSQTIYVSSDPSPIYAVNPGDGSVRWRSYTTSFGYQDNIAQTADGSRIAIAAKYGGYLILDKDGNDIFRSGAPEGQHAALAASDGAFYLSSAGFHNGAHLLDPTGKLFWWNSDTNEGTMLSADEKLILLGASLYELGGTQIWTDSAASAGGPHVAVITPDKKHILTAGEDGKIYFFEGQVCTPSLSETSTAVDRNGGAVTVNIAVNAGCGWTATANNTSITLASGSSGTGNATVQFNVDANTSGGARTGTLTIAGWTFTVVQADTAVPLVSLDHTALNFGVQGIGTSSTAQTITLTNTGGAALNLSSISGTGDFAVTNNCGSGLGVGGSCSLNVVFTPTAVGARTGAISIASDAAGSPHSASLSGTGIGPAVSLTPTSLTFTDQHIGTPSPAQTVTLTNTGNAALTIASIAPSVNVFAVTHNCPIGPATLAASGSCNLSVTFTPDSAGTRVGSISVTSNASGSPQSVTVSGVGVASNVPICTLAATPASVRRNGTSILTPTCTPAATTYAWTGGTCEGTTAPTCTVTPAATTTYGVTGTNSYGFSTANAEVTVKAVDLTPILMLLLD